MYRILFFLILKRNKIELVTAYEMKYSAICIEI